MSMCLYIQERMYDWICEYLYIHIYVHKYMCACKCVLQYFHVCDNMHTYVFTHYVQVYVSSYMHVSMGAFMCVMLMFICVSVYVEVKYMCVHDCLDA